MNLHAHIDTYSTDCDGPITREYVITPNDDEIAEHVAAEKRGYNDFSEIHFHNRVVASVVTTYGSFRGGHLDVVVDDEYGNVSLEWSEPTEEGSRHVTARFCTDDCTTDAQFYRDHRAESMGY